MTTAKSANIWEVILLYYKNGDIKRIVGNVDLSHNKSINDELRLDLEHDIVEILLKCPEKTIDLHNRGKLGVYISSTAKRLVYGSNSNYRKKIVAYEKNRISIESISE